MEYSAYGSKILEAITEVKTKNYCNNDRFSICSRCIDFLKNLEFVEKYVFTEYITLERQNQNLMSDLVDEVMTILNTTNNPSDGENSISSTADANEQKKHYVNWSSRMKEKLISASAKYDNNIDLVHRKCFPQLQLRQVKNEFHYLRRIGEIDM